MVFDTVTPDIDLVKGIELFAVPAVSRLRVEMPLDGRAGIS